MASEKVLKEDSMDNSMDKNKEKTRMPGKEVFSETSPAENTYTLQIGPITPDSVSVDYPVSVPLVVVLDGNRYILGDITFSPDGSIESVGLVRRLSQDTLKFIRRHSAGGFAIGRVQMTSGLYTREPFYSKVEGSGLQTPVQDYKGDFEPEEDYRQIPYVTRAGFSKNVPEVVLVDPAMNPYEHGSVNWLRSTVGMAPVTDEQIAEVMKTFPSADAWNSMIFDLQIAQPPVIVSAMNRMFPPQPE
jgi:hypothetical protein